MATMEYYCNEVGSNSGMDVILEKYQKAIILFFRALTGEASSEKLYTVLITML